MYISRNDINIHASWYSSNLASTLRKTFTSIIPNRSIKVISMIENGTAGSFTANNRSVNVSSDDYVEIR